MKAKVGFAKRALILGGLLIGTAGLALMPGSANAGNLIGVDVGPLSVGIGAGGPDYVAPAPTPAPVPSTSYVMPSTTYVEPAPPTETAPAPQTSVPQSRAHTTTETTTYYGPGDPTTYPGY